MAAPEGFSKGRGSSRDLPAPWQNPWGLLWRDLGAVLASLGLGLRELWRRNGEGSLWRPAFWPRAGAMLFWPLLVLALVLLLGLGGRSLLAARRPPPTIATARDGSPTPQAAKSPGSDGSSGAATSLSPTAATAPSPPPASAPQTMESEPPATTPAQPSPEETELGARSPAEPQPPSAALPPPDPLLRELAPDDPEGWIGATRAEPGASRLTLILADRFGALPEPQRLALAGQWQRRAESLGYEDLRLRDGKGRLLARRALVGSGMILLEFPAAPSED